MSQPESQIKVKASKLNIIWQVYQVNVTPNLANGGHKAKSFIAMSWAGKYH